MQLDTPLRSLASGKASVCTIGICTYPQLDSPGYNLGPRAPDGADDATAAIKRAQKSKYFRQGFERKVHVDQDLRTR